MSNLRAKPMLSTEPSLGTRRAVRPQVEIRVQQEGGKEADRSVIVDGERVRVGSHDGNHVVLDDRLVSRFHFELVKGEAGWSVRDVGSRNGTHVGGLAVRDADLTAEITHVQLGQSVLQIRTLADIETTEAAVLPGFGSLLGASPPMLRLFSLLKRVAGSETDLLVEGESGTGKELVAAEVVQHSARAQKPLIVVDCGAITPSLIESELFGHARGSFTGAHRDRVGAFEAADGGTIFLDEIGELPLDMQPKLLRALAQREVRRIGEERARKVDVRVVAATNRKLEREVNEGRFREDLFYRLTVVTLRVPSLRERKTDIPLLVEHFLAGLGASDKLHIFHDLMPRMLGHEWPGNVRELRNYVERMALLDGDDPDDAARRVEGKAEGKVDRDESAAVAVQNGVGFREAKEEVVRAFERSYLAALFEAADGNVSLAARRAGIDRMHLHRLFQRYAIR